MRAERRGVGTLRWWAWEFWARTPCASLLVAQLVTVLIYPFLEESSADRAGIAVIGIVVLGLAVRAVRATPSLAWASLVLAVPAVLLLLAELVTGNSAFFPWSSAFEAALYFYAAVALLRYMLADDVVTTDELFAIGAVFTVIAWGFAHVYVVVQSIWPGSFTASIDPDSARSWMDLLFLSFTTLSSTGLSDIIPIRPHARSVVMFEQVAGVFFLAMVVTRLVGLSSGRSRQRRQVQQRDQER